MSFQDFFFTLILSHSVGQRGLEMYFLTSKPPRLLIPCTENSHSSNGGWANIFFIFDVLKSELINAHQHDGRLSKR